MSKIGNQPINIPDGVTIIITNDQIQVSGPKGNLQQRLLPGIQVDKKDSQLVITRTNDHNQTKSCDHGNTSCPCK